MEEENTLEAAWAVTGLGVMTPRVISSDI